MKVIAVITDPFEVNKILECLKRNNAPPFDKGALKALDSLILSHSYVRRNTQGREVSIPIFSNYDKSQFLIKYHGQGSMFIKKAEGSHRQEQLEINNEQIGGLFAASLSKIVESLFIKITINKRLFAIIAV